MHGRGAPLVVENLIGNLRFIVVEVVISSGRPTGTAATIADVAVKLLGERLHLAPQDVLFVFHEVEPNLPRFPAASIRRFDPKADIRGRG